MWILFISAAAILFGGIQGQQQPTVCNQVFGRGLQVCFRDNAGMEQPIAFSLLSNGSTGALPPNMNKAALTQQMCTNYQQVGSCLQQVITNADPSCQQNEVGSNQGTVNSIMASAQALCGIVQQASQCMQQFEASFSNCLTQIQINADQFKQFLSNPAGLPSNVNPQQFKQQACSDTTKTSLMQCATTIATTLKDSCGPADAMAVGQTLQGMLNQYQFVCTGKSASQCRNNYGNGINACAQKLYSMDMNQVLGTLNSTQPNAPNRGSVESKFCPLLNEFEICAKDVIVASNCPVTQLIPVELDFANVVMKFATFCRDNSIPGICLLTLQKEFGNCFGTVGLDPKIYLSNGTDHKGALIGSNLQESEVYCRKKHDLFTCMTEVMHKCPGAEQTMAMTGFDIHGMERAVGILCQDIPDYLKGLECFAEPSPQASKCMDAMTLAITTLSSKQLTGGKPSMDTFFTDFCSARVRHVGCDGNAWPNCERKAVELKNKFECQLVPTKCHKSHRDHIDDICPLTDMIMLSGNTKIHKHEHAACAQNIHETMNTCFQKHGLEPDMFLVNITHDRGNFLGDNGRAKSLCSSKESVFECMRGALRACPEANDMLAFWGHQQSALEAGVKMICDELNVYNKGQSCLAGNSRISQCMASTNTRMFELARKHEEKDLSTDAYFRDFCAIRIEHLKCDLGGWGSGSCSADVMGLKTEFECSLIQGRCKTLQVYNLKSICNPQAYAKTSRKSSSLTSGNNGNSAANIFISGLTLTFSVATSIMWLFL